MSLLRSIVVDDEPLARELVEGYVNQTPFLESAGSYPDALSAMEAIRNGMQAELLFLDIQMPNLSGLELSRLLPPEMKVIFITAFEQYAVEGFRVEALDYLLKPVSYADFLSAAQKAQRQFELERGAVKANVSVEERSIFVKTDYKIVQIHLDSVLYLEGVKDYVRIHTDDGPVMTLMSMKAMEDALPDTRFIRVHRSFIVNLDRVTTIERNRIVFGKVYIPITDSYPGVCCSVPGTARRVSYCRRCGVQAPWGYFMPFCFSFLKECPAYVRVPTPPGRRYAESGFVRLRSAYILPVGALPDKLFWIPVRLFRDCAV